MTSKDRSSRAASSKSGSPSTRLSIEAIRERAGAVSSILHLINWLHVWWARRPSGPLSRAAVCASPRLIPIVDSCTRIHFNILIGTYPGIIDDQSSVNSTIAKERLGVTLKEGVLLTDESFTHNLTPAETDWLTRKSRGSRPSGCGHHGWRR